MNKENRKTICLIILHSVCGERRPGFDLPFQMGKLAGEELLFYRLASPFSPGSHET